VPDKAAAKRGGPIYQQNCSFCHGPQARGATAPSLVTADEVLADDHGEHLVPFLKNGRPEKGMPAFATMSEGELNDIAEFLHLQVDQIANRGAYRPLNILVGDRDQGQAYVNAHCLSCHSAGTVAHIGSRFRSPEQLQRGWVWPSRPADGALDPTAAVTTRDGRTISGRVVQISDFRITLLDREGRAQSIDRLPGVMVLMKDPLAAHEELIKKLNSDDMHNVTAYLDSLK
jgi:cytochrome c oxidase cbb3-type subunit III